MEVYEFNKTEQPAQLCLGKYFGLVHGKHKGKYGEIAAINIRDNIQNTFRHCLNQCQNNPDNPNVLLVGKVQSGKTSNLELFTALAIDNGYNLVVIYGGYDTYLLKQTRNTFVATFDIPDQTNYSDSSPVIFTSDDNITLSNITDQNIEDFLDNNKPIFLVSLKRPPALQKINEFLKRIDKTRIKSFIIDDEGDQASLNTKKNKAEASATYQQICDMKDLLSNPLYLSVTATPQANIFLDEMSRLRPASIRLIEPGDGYCGANIYHLSDDLSLVDFSIKASDAETIVSEGFPDSLQNALFHFFIASAVLLARGINDSDMIIHTHRTISEHSVIYSQIEQLISDYQENIRRNQIDQLNVLSEELESSYNKYFKHNTDVPPFEKLKPSIWEVVKRIHVILKNSAGEITQGNESMYRYRIHIGGDLLQRGLAFRHLVTTYFLRWAKNGGNMDTNLQRARWFGYRNTSHERYIDVCKLFTTEDVAREFANLAQMENDLWNQFYQIQDGSKKIENLLVLAEDTQQKPTRKNVATYKKISFRQEWNCQKIGFFDPTIVLENNKTIDDFKAMYEWEETRKGRKQEDAATGHFSSVPTNAFIKLIETTKEIFDHPPFNKTTLIENLKRHSTVNIILMDRKETRQRSFFSNNQIKALQQGADSADKSKVNYQGDSEVFIDKEGINIQIHKVIPKKQKNDGDVEVLTNFEQYMFAISIPDSRDYYARGDK